MKRPHILMIISHDTGRHLGCYGAAVRTPNLDRLAAEGIRFEQNFCVAAQCSPSRGSLMTGRYPHKNGLIGLAHLGWSMNEDEVCLPQYLTQAGYETHLFGFQHEVPKGRVERLGYQHFHPTPHNFIHEVAPLVEEFLAARAAGADEPPLFLMVGVEETHRNFAQPIYTPDDPAEVVVPPYLPDAPGVREDLAWFQGTVKALDEGVGRILKALADAGLAEETLVVYTTDHGIAFPRAKGMSYDPGLETALIMRWPGRIQPGTVQRRMITHLDFLPTLLEAVGAPRPQNLDGESYLPLLGGGECQTRDSFFLEMTWHDRYNPHRGIRTERFKYIRNFDPDATLVYVPLDIHSGPAGTALPPSFYDKTRPVEELYDLANDPLEQQNLAGDAAYAEVLADLRMRVQRWMEQTNDPLLKGPVAPTPEQARIDWSPKG
ncbi:MAG: sulfatase [Bacillota bacterium]